MYNPTCLVTGNKDNLRMHPLRNKNNDMIGWVFLHESIEQNEIKASVKWDYEIKVGNDLIKSDI